MSLWKSGSIPVITIVEPDHRHPVGGGGGDRFPYCAPAGGRFANRAPGREQYDFGPPRRGFESYDEPRFPRRGGRQSRAPRDWGNGMYACEFANPTFEQIARHLFASFQTNPSVGLYAHPMNRY